MGMLWPGLSDLIVPERTSVSAQNVKKLTSASEMAWEGLKSKDINTFSKEFLDSFNAQVTMFP